LTFSPFGEIINYIELGVFMEYVNLTGFSVVHLDKDKHSVLREKRLVLGLTQQQVADKAKIAYTQYQRLESGERSIMSASFQLACRVIKALEMDIDKFYNGDYVIGEELVETSKGLFYKKGGRPFNKEIEEKE